MNALLTSGDGREMPITSQAELAEALEALPLVESGRTVSLFRGPKHYVKATRRGEFWSVDARRGGWWTLGSFTADMTSDHSERQVRESRAAGSLWKRLALIFASPPPEHQLSTGQVRTIFAEFLLGRPFTLPRSGA